MPEQKYIFLQPEDIGTDKDPFHVLWLKLEKRKEYRAANTVAKRLHRRLIAMGEDVEEPKRLFHGHHQRSAGAWSWQAMYKGGSQYLGSAYSMGDCLKMTDAELDAALES